MKLGIMQPYFLPYIGYWQLIASVDEFIVYDNIQYTKKGWINRNRILVNGKDSYITLPLKKDSDFLDVKDRYLADTWAVEKNKMLNIINQNYKKAPYFDEAFNVIVDCILYDTNNLFVFLLHSIYIIKEYLDIKTPITISSNVDINHKLKAEQKVIEFCKAKKASTYINAIGGEKLYSKKLFADQGIELNFIKSNPILFKQFRDQCLPWLSILDVMMFNPKEYVQQMLTEYKLI